jgi:hypothetical protein
MHDADSQSSVEHSPVQLIVDQIEELIATVIEEVRQRPSVAVAILAAVTGAVVGSMLAARTRRRRISPKSRAARTARGMTDAADLAGLALRLMQNPLVRSYIRSAVEKQVKQRFSM